jgi:hypothetical protein
MMEEAWLLQGKKLIWYEHEDRLRPFADEHPGFVIESIPRTSAIASFYVKHALYPVGHRHIFLQFLAILDRFPELPVTNQTYRHIGIHIDLGKILGYSDADICYYLRHNHNECHFVKWQTGADVY